MTHTLDAERVVHGDGEVERGLHVCRCGHLRLAHQPACRWCGVDRCAQFEARR